MDVRSFLTALVIVACLGPPAFSQEPAHDAIPTSLDAQPPEMEFAPADDEAGPHESDDYSAPIVVEPGQMNECFVRDFMFEFPAWYTRADAIWLDRTFSGDTTTGTIRFDDGSLGVNRINNNEGQFQPGLRAVVGRNFWDYQTFFEANYFGLNHWNERTALGHTGALNTNGFGIIRSHLDMGLGDLDPNGSGTFLRLPLEQLVEYSATIHNAELNVRSFFSPNFAFIGGVRFMSLAERLQIFETGLLQGTPYAASRFTTVGNYVIAPQLGIDYFRNCTDDIRWGGYAKIAVGANFSEMDIRQTANPGRLSLTTPSLGNTARAQFDDEAAITGILEAGWTLDVRLTRNLTLKGGYQLMWVYGIAQASEQRPSPITNPNGLQSQIENGSDALFHGPFIGLELGWGDPEY